ncbi:MAG: 4-hydroxyproline epimerase [Bacteroidia bacterium]|nr:MAG: 4-hydroxyproline epimerase [Bacteroidia bacterium]
MARKMFFCIDSHTCGNPVRVVAGGAPLPEGRTMFEKRLNFIENWDWVRQGLMFEPRGHDLMSGSILYPPSDPENDAGILFIETSGCLPMCGHGTIGSMTVAIEEGLIVPKIAGRIKLETPAGLILVEYKQEGKKVKSVKIINVPSFLAGEMLEIDYPPLGKLIFDVAYGGNFYAIFDPQTNFPGLHHFTASEIIPWSREIRLLINRKYNFEHPEMSQISGVSHVMWTGEPLDKDSTSRNAVFYGEKAIDRSPCGTGTSARMAQWVAKGKLKEGDTFIHESIIGSKFTGTVEKLTTVCGLPAIIPGIEGWARITGYNNIIIDDEDDPFAHGFQVI